MISFFEPLLFGALGAIAAEALIIYRALWHGIYFHRRIGYWFKACLVVALSGGLVMIYSPDSPVLSILLGFIFPLSIREFFRHVGLDPRPEDINIDDVFIERQNELTVNVSKRIQSEIRKWLHENGR